MADVFKLSDIKAGYLLVVKNEDKEKEFNMTVVPAKELDLGFLGYLFGVGPATKDGDLACCGDGEYWPLSRFNDNLTYKGLDKCVVVRIYGYTAPSKLLSNTTEQRELLWERETEADAAEEAKGPAWLNGKVVCVANKYEGYIPVPGFTVGKVYVVKDGRVTTDNGWTSHIPAETVEALCRGIGHTFIPFVGEQE